MEINDENLDKEPNQLNNQENAENDNNEENGEEGIEGMGLNYEGEYDGQMEGEEEIVEMEQNEPDGQEEEAIEGGEEEQIYNGEEEMVNEDHEEAQENEGEEYVQQNEEEKKENDIEIKNEQKIENENNLKNIENTINIQNCDNKNNNSDIKKNISNKKRIELLNNKLNSNNKAKTIKTENIIDKDVEEDKNDKNNNFKTFNFSKRNDILSELLGKIQDFKQKKQDTSLKLNANNSLEELDKDIIKGLENLNNINNRVNTGNILNEEQKVSRPQLERKILRNPKFKEIVSLINEKDYKRSKYYYHNIGKADLLDYMNNKYNSNFYNINFFNSKKNKYTTSNILENKTLGNNYKKYGNDNNKIYISCIDGKAIVNGIRKEIPFISKFNFGDKLNNNKNLFDDLFKTGKSSRRNNSFNINKYIKNNEFNFDGNKTHKNYGAKDFNFDKLKSDFSKENLTSKLNKMNDNYFSRELKFFK